MLVDTLVAFEPSKTPSQARSTVIVEAISEATIQVLPSATRVVVNCSAPWLNQSLTRGRGIGTQFNQQPTLPANVR
jgi:hypothetical protein